MKKKTVFTICFAVLVCIGIAAGFYFLSKNKEPVESEQEQPAYDFADEAYQKAAVTLAQKLYATDIDGLFYSLSPVKYYYAKGGTIKELSAKTTLQVSPVVAGVEMAFQIPLVEIGKRSFGIGVWHADEGIYNDVFAVVEDMPATYVSPYTYVLCLDTSRSDAGAASALYSELICLGADGSVGDYLFSQNNRTTEPSGKLRTDWDCATLSLLRQGYTLSGRKYNHSDEAQKYDLLQTVSGRTDTCQSEISDTFLYADKKNIYYTAAQDGAWAVFCGTGEGAKEIVRLEGEPAAYTVNGFTAYRSGDNTAVHLLSGKAVAGLDAFKSVYSLAGIGTKTVTIGKEQNKVGLDYKVQKICLADSKSGQTRVYYANDIFDENTPLLLCAQGMLTQKGGKSVFISFKALESLPYSVLE